MIECSMRALFPGAENSTFHNEHKRASDRCCSSRKTYSASSFNNHRKDGGVLLRNMRRDRCQASLVGQRILCR
jgi:hypothetical protein